MLPGDFGLVAIPGGVGRLIRVAQFLNGDGYLNYQHAVLALDDGTLVEAEPGGARIMPIAEYEGTNIVWSSWSLTDIQRKHIVTVARRLVGTPYSFLDYLGLAAHRLHIPAVGLHNYIASSGHMICSQLVDYCYRWAGLPMFADSRWPGYVTPLALHKVLTGPQSRG